MSSPEQPPRFFIDRSLGRKAIPEALRADGWDIVTLGTAGLVAGGGETALALAKELVAEWQTDERSDFAWLMRSSGITWP